MQDFSTVVEYKIIFQTTFPESEKLFSKTFYDSTKQEHSYQKTNCSTVCTKLLFKVAKGSLQVFKLSSIFSFVPDSFLM